MDVPPYEFLQSFLAFAESPSMVLAAQKLGMSQPLLTKHLQKLEEWAPQPVFTFEGRRKVMTRYGRALYAVFKKHVSGLENGLQELNLLESTPDRITLRIAGRRELLTEIADLILFPGRLVFLPMDGADVLQALSEARIELGLSQHPLDSHSYGQKPFLQDRMQIAVPKDWALKARRTIDLLRELRTRPYLSYGASDLSARVYRHYGLEHHAEPYRQFPSWPTIARMVHKKFGWSILPQRFASTHSLTAFDIPTEALPDTHFKMYYPLELGSRPWFREILKTLGEIKI